ncbi:hypothetical protein NDU88_002526 [Pleurodeles waltl]|uniref:Uncharacterized protein n=1 Tax=Pleurodeles waltl TaxID=8319 RepID=A0AAV7LPI5_PLEWA|nr:hypothetical protein NDU88_002526 [Pleurodeles waltl]
MLPKVSPAPPTAAKASDRGSQGAGRLLSFLLQCAARIACQDQQRLTPRATPGGCLGFTKGPLRTAGLRGRSQVPAPCDRPCPRLRREFTGGPGQAET